MLLVRYDQDKPETQDILAVYGFDGCELVPYIQTAAGDLQDGFLIGRLTEHPLADPATY